MKSNKKSSHTECFFALMAFALQNQVKPGQGPVAAICHRWPALQATFPTALQPQRPPLFYLISSEALRMTVSAQNQILLTNMQIKKASSGLSANRAVLSGLAGGRILLT